LTLDEAGMTAFVITNALEGYRAELEARRRRDAEIKRKYGLRSLEQLIMEAEAKLIDYELRKSQGANIPEATVQREERRKQELEARKRELEETIQREVSLLPATPRILGVARVVPSVPPAEEAEWHPSAEIEARGMEVAMRYEREQGREPEDVSTENLGFDIRSTAPDGSVRYIEVKARAGTGAIVLTPNEWLMAHRLRGEYWLYIVEWAATDPKLYTIQDPASKLQPETVYEAVRYIVKDWKEAVSHDA
jgi:hypothetical protein